MSRRGRRGRRSVLERIDDATRLKVAFVGTVAASGGLVAVQGDASLDLVGLSAAFGAVVGVALLWYLRWIT